MKYTDVDVLIDSVRSLKKRPDAMFKEDIVTVLYIARRALIILESQQRGLDEPHERDKIVDEFLEEVLSIPLIR